MSVKGRAKEAMLPRRLVAIGILPTGALLASGCNALFGIDDLEPLAAGTTASGSGANGSGGSGAAPTGPGGQGAAPTSSSGGAGGGGGGGSGGCTAVEVALGGLHTCARKDDGSLWCWGDNTDGKLGDGTTMLKSSPTQVPVLGTTVAEVALGGGHTCARKNDGSLWCWGSNALGQLGDGTFMDKPSPVELTALGTTVVEVALGAAHSCAGTEDGVLSCWGVNGAGQLGDGSTVNKSSPAQVSSLTSVVEVALGANHTCARKKEGSLWCWGQNASGQLGDGSTAPKTSPAKVSAFGTYAEVALGGAHTCARENDGSLWSWGYNSSGQLGDGSTVNKSSPTHVSALGKSVAGVALGSFHTCARKNDGSLWCWGAGSYGQLGDGTKTDRTSPVQVSMLTAVADVALGDGHTCARTEDGSLWCWGRNSSGQLGDGSTMDKPTPVQVSPCP
jgi:alpha-tubulin suppressor-like RCC1 family protein